MNIVRYTFIVLLLGGATSAMSQNKSIETPTGSVSVTKETVNPAPQNIVMVSPTQNREIDRLAAMLPNFVATYRPRVLKPTLKDVDEAFRVWQTEKKRHYTQQQVVEILGAYLGNKLASDFQMEWVLVTDSYGTDFAVRGKKQEVMSFPFSSVSKRIQNKEYDFIEGVYYTVKHMMASGEYKSR